MARNWNPKYKINIVTVFNRAYREESKALRDAIRPTLSNDGLKRLYAQFVINEIVDRTKKGLDRKGKVFTGYSKSYQESIEFKLFKSQRFFRDLKLTGEMLASINPAAMTAFTITFGFTGAENRGKAQGHITGKLGKGGKVTPRDFFGLPLNLEEKLLREAMVAFRGTNREITAELFEDSLTNFDTTVETPDTEDFDAS